MAERLDPVESTDRGGTYAIAGIETATSARRFTPMVALDRLAGSRRPRRGRYRSRSDGRPTRGTPNAEAFVEAIAGGIVVYLDRRSLMNKMIGVSFTACRRTRSFSRRREVHQRSAPLQAEVARSTIRDSWRS